MSLINVSLVGNLARAPEQMCFASGRVKTTMTVAVNHPGRAGKKTESVDFYRVETWGSLAELAGKYLSKGNQIAVCGRLFLDHWIDKQGKNRVTPIVEATQLSLPPRARTVNGDEAAESTVGANPIGGEIDLPDQEGDAHPTANDAAYGNLFNDDSEAASKPAPVATA